MSGSRGFSGLPLGRWGFLLTLFQFLAIAPQAQPTLTASVDRRELALGETVSVRFELRGSNDVKSFVPPDFIGLTVIHGPETRLEFVSDRGLKVPAATFAYLLKPERAGVLEIGSAMAVPGGLSVSSPPVHIRVSQDPTQTKDSVGQTESDRLVDAAVRKGLFIRLDADRTVAYVGEPILVTYRLYTRLNSESQVIQRPSFAGFSVVEVQRSDSSAPIDEVIDGQTFQSYVLRKVHLIPLREGEYELEPVVVQNRVTLGDPASPANGSSLSRLLSKLYPDGSQGDRGIKTEVTLRSPSRRIRVLPLPSGAPSDFSGAVGRFRLSIETESDTLPKGGVGRLLMVMEGSGNLPFAVHPKLEWPEGLEPFDSEVMDETDPSRTPLSGKRTLVVPFSSNTKGNFTVRALSMSAFDPSTGKYYSLKADSTAVFITDPATSVAKSADASPGRADKGITLPLTLILACALAALAFAFAWRHPRRGSHGAHRKDESPTAASRKPATESYDAGLSLQSASRLLSEGRPAECCRELHRALSGAAESLCGVSYASGRERFTDALVRIGVQRRDAEDWADLLHDCEVEAFRFVVNESVVAGLLERAGRILSWPQSGHERISR